MSGFGVGFGLLVFGYCLVAWFVAFGGLVWLLLWVCIVGFGWFCWDDL